MIGNSELQERMAEQMEFALSQTPEALAEDNAKLRELLQRLLVEYRYMRVRPRKTYLQHEGRMRAIEEEIRELGVEVD